jgi:hypothetical protein
MKDGKSTLMNAMDAYEERKERLKVNMDGSSEIVERN